MIRELLAKAERAATEAETETEAQAYNAEAAEPMARHGVDAALLAASGEQPDANVDRPRGWSPQQQRDGGAEFLSESLA
ncbi:MAG: hypothetical protein QOF00_990 [Pseudonocardiales bacterium]|jgi:hypothetical protein|nr:hypothetical protein [Pseudonocardiales bacterium]